MHKYVLKRSHFNAVYFILLFPQNVLFFNFCAFLPHTVRVSKCLFGYSWKFNIFLCILNFEYMIIAKNDKTSNKSTTDRITIVIVPKLDYHQNDRNYSFIHDLKKGKIIWIISACLHYAVKYFRWAVNINQWGKIFYTIKSSYRQNAKLILE